MIFTVYFILSQNIIYLLFFILWSLYFSTSLVRSVDFFLFKLAFTSNVNVVLWDKICANLFFFSFYFYIWLGFSVLIGNWFCKIILLLLRKINLKIYFIIVIFYILSIFILFPPINYFFYTIPWKELKYDFFIMCFIIIL